MGPVHVAPDGALGIVLMEHVIASAEKDGTVGIVHPVAGGQKMILRTQGISSKFLLDVVNACRILNSANECRADGSAGGEPNE